MHKIIWSSFRTTAHNHYFSPILAGSVTKIRSFNSNMSKPKVLVTNFDVPKPALDILREKFDVTITEQKPAASRKQILDKIKGIDALLWCTRERLDDEVLDAAGPNLKVVATMSSGLDHIDVPALKRRNIPLGSTPKVLDNAVADVAILLTLAASRRFQEGRMHIEQGIWEGYRPQYLCGTDIKNSTVGIVGFGGIGQAIAKRLKGFDVSRITYCGHRVKPEAKQFGAEFVPFETLLRDSDFVIVAAPLTAETKNLFNENTFAKMKKNAVFVNIARGPIVDQDALIQALKNGTIFAAGLDVMVPEPLPTDHELIKLPNCVLMPHLGSATINTRKEMSELTVNNIILGFENKPLLTPVY